MTTYAYESVDDANAEIGRLIAELADVRQANRALLAQLDEANTDRVRLKNAANKQDDEVCQIIGKALGYPEYEGGGGVCVVPHVGPTIAAEIVDKLADIRLRWKDAKKELAALRTELEQARRWSATLWRVVRAYRGYMAGLVRDTSLYMESDDEAWRRHMSDWSEIRRAEQAKQAGEA